jgi:sugar lactone lactonase YvrE
VRLDPLYRLEFDYPESWRVDLGSEEQHFFVAEGRATGFLTGRFRGANHPRRRADGTFCPDFQGVIETDDGATVFVDMQGYGRAYPEGRRQVVAASTHLSDDERYRRLNDAVCVCTGEVWARGGPGMNVVLDVAELVWEPFADEPGA